MFKVNKHHAINFGGKEYKSGDTLPSEFNKHADSFKVCVSEVEAEAPKKQSTRSKAK